MEAEFEKKLDDLKTRHKSEIDEAAGGEIGTEGVSVEAVPADSDSKAAGEKVKQEDDKEKLERERKQEKARRKREAKKEKERQRKLELERETAEAGPSARAIELGALESQLAPLALKIKEIPSDGNCLYRAIAAQCGDKDFHQIRKYVYRFACVCVCMCVYSMVPLLSVRYNIAWDCRLVVRLLRAKDLLNQYPGVVCACVSMYNLLFNCVSSIGH